MHGSVEKKHHPRLMSPTMTCCLRATDTIGIIHHNRFLPEGFDITLGTIAKTICLPINFSNSRRLFLGCCYFSKPHSHSNSAYLVREQYV